MSKKQIKLPMQEEVLGKKEIAYANTGLVVVPTFKNHHNATAFAKRYETPSGESQTVPNQSLTIQEIYKRYASGRPLMGNINPVYDDDGTGKITLDFDDYMPDLSRMDLADRQSIMEQAKAELDEVKKRLNATASARKQQSDKREKELLDRIKKLEEGKVPAPAPSAGGDLDKHD